MMRPGSDALPQGPATRDGGRLLIVDDNVDYLKTLEMLLDDTGYTCRFCDNGPAAIEAARNEEFDVLLTDVRMAPVDGVETARRVKASQPLIAVIMMTGFDREDTPLEALRLGAVDYIDKPITDVGAFLRLLGHQVRLVQSAKQLRATKERLEAVLENIDTGVVVLNSDGLIEDINPAAKALVAPDEQDVLGRLLREVCRIPELLLPAPHAETVSTTFERTIDARKRLIQVDVTRLAGLPRRWAGTVLLIKDLTAIAESQKAEGWRQVSRAITHGMKTPLGTLRMRLERLVHLPSAGLLHDEADVLLRVVGELHARLSDLVDFVKLDLSFATGDVNAAVARAVRHFEMHRSAATQIDFEPGQDLPSVRFSSAGLELAIENLLANSQEAGEDGVAIKVSTRRDDERPGVVIAVEDNGRGIGPEVRDDIFRRPLNSTKPGGSGLGAALVKYIVDQHHGALTWQSPILPTGGGTRVTLRLPAHGAPPPTPGSMP